MSITRLAAVACARISRQRLSTSSIRNDAQSSLTTKSTPTAGKIGAFSEWCQLLVQVGGNIRVVYLDTSLQRLLYDPSITAVDSNLATHFLFQFAEHDQGPFVLRNRVTPNAGPNLQPAKAPLYNIVFQDILTRALFTAHAPGRQDTFAIYAAVPRNPNRRIYFRPTTPERSGKPRRNKILGHEIAESEFKCGDNFVFLRGPRPKPSESLPEIPLLPADTDDGQVEGKLSD